MEEDELWTAVVAGERFDRATGRRRRAFAIESLSTPSALPLS
jgi:hypothetical protein